MSHIYPLTQFEVRFTQILNFNQIIREILSPYLRMSSTFNFFNQGRFEESIKLNFEEDQYSIDCRWDRIVFYCENDPNRFAQQNSTMKIFWEILEKLTSIPTFGALRNFVFLNYEINILDKQPLEILKNFKSKFFTNEIDRIMKEPNEIAVILEKTTSNKVTAITFGPYSNADNKKYNFFPFKGEKVQEVQDKFGTLLKIQVSDQITKIDTELFKKLLEEQKDFSKRYII